MKFVNQQKQPLHILGSIQSFGFIIGINANSHTINFFSENIIDLFEINDYNKLLDNKISDFPEYFQTILDSNIFKNIDQLTIKENETYFDKILINDKQFHFSVFRSKGDIFLEFEEVIINPDKRITNKYDNFYILENDKEIWEKLLNTLTNIINYDRLLIYKFMEDGSGKIIAEKNNSSKEGNLGEYYPEYLIPVKARDLYVSKRKRIFSDVNSDVVKLISHEKKEIDLTFANSRSLSKAHVQNIKNSGASANFSISIIINDQLWGLVTCQNELPKHIDLEDRVQAAIFTVLAANVYSTFKTKKEADFRLQLSSKLFELKTEFLQYNTLFDSLVENKERIKTIAKADGLAIIADNYIITEGDTPNEKLIQKIVDWAYENMEDNIFVSRNFGKNFSEKIFSEDNCAGVIIYFIEKSKNELLIWFRKEFKEEIVWVNDPFLRDFENNEVLPLISTFEKYHQKITGRSKRWSSRSIITVQSIRDLILETSHKQYIIIKNLNEKLNKANEELDSFSYTISHDLGTPLTVMKLNAQMLLKNLDPDDIKSKNKINSIINEIDSMASMMQDVLQLSRAKHSDLVLQNLETSNTINTISENAKLNYESPNCIINIKNCPNVLADKTMMYQVFLNIINNAVKYSSKKEIPKIEIEGKEEKDKIVYTIVDNGIGILEADKNKLFKMFSRLDNAKKFKGNGVGLSIVHRIMQRLGGEVDYRSSNEGTCFILTFQKPMLELVEI